MKLHWGNAIVIFFTLFISLGIFFIIFSLRQHNDLVDDNYYEKGAAYTLKIEIDKRSALFTDSITIKNKGQEFILNFSTSITTNTDIIKVHFYRPSNKKFDFKTSIDPTTSDFTILKSNLKKGRYIVKFTWQMSGSEYEIDKILFVD